MKVDKFRTVIIYIIIILLGLVCLLPLLNIVAISLLLTLHGVEGNMVGLIPVGFSTAALMRRSWRTPQFCTLPDLVERVVLTLIINFVLIVLMAYPLSKTNAQFQSRNIYANLMIFCHAFQRRHDPHLPACQILRPAHTVWALVLPGAVPIFNVILVMNFFAAVPPKEFEEAAKLIEGAQPAQVLTKNFIPISKPVLHTVSPCSALWAAERLTAA